MNVENNQRLVGFPFIQVNDNHSYFADKVKDHFFKAYGEQNLKVHHSQFDSIGLLKSTQIAIGSDIFSDLISKDSKNGFSSTIPIWRKVMFIEKRKNIKRMMGTFDTIFRFDSIANIKNKTIEPLNLNQNITRHNKTQFINDTLPLFQYSNIYVKPISPDWSSDNGVLAQIYYASDPGVNHNWYEDVDIQPSSLDSTGNNNLKIEFEKMWIREKY